MHEWHTRTSSDIMSLINEFMGYEFRTDYSGEQKVRNIGIINEILSADEESVRGTITSRSYGGNTAYLAAFTTKKYTKTFLSAFSKFIEKYKEYVTFDRNLNIGYGRTSTKVSCPHCHSSISMAFGKRYKTCPVCGSEEIISKSNRRLLKVKYKQLEKHSAALQKMADKNGVQFMCGIEWHC